MKRLHFVAQRQYPLSGAVIRRYSVFVFTDRRTKTQGDSRAGFLEGAKLSWMQHLLRFDLARARLKALVTGLVFGQSLTPSLHAGQISYCCLVLQGEKLVIPGRIYRVAFGLTILSMEISNE